MMRLRYLAAIVFLIAFALSLLRLALLLRYLPLAAGIPLGVMFQSFVTGVRFDLVVTGYIVGPVALIGMLPFVGWDCSRWVRRGTTIWLTVLGSIVLLAGIADMEFYGQFSSRLNHIALGWSDTPGLSLKIVWETTPVIPYLLGWFGMTGLLGWALVRIESLGTSERREPLWRGGLFYLLSLILLFLMVRGRLSEKTPINWSVAYFSQYNFANQLSLNSAYTFIQDAVLDQDERNEANLLSDALPAKEAYARTREMLGIDEQSLISGFPLAHREGSGTEHQFNVVLVIGESLCSVFMKSAGGVEDLSPELDNIARQSVLFPHFYSSGSHTFTGIFSTVTGYPSPLGKSLMKRSEGQQDFGGLASVLGRRGYTCWFYVPHDPHFDNMQGFLHLNGYERVIGQFDFPQEQVLSTLGVPDGVMLERALEDMAALPKPFLVTLLTSTHHGPFRIPADAPSPRVEPGSSNEERFNAALYADWALGRFVDGIAASEWGDSTIIVILGDHGVSWKPTLSVDPSLFRVPLIIYAPWLLTPRVSETIGGQPDVTATVMGALGGEWINSSFGRNLLASDDGFALLVKDVEMGFLTGNRFLIRNRDGGLSLLKYPEFEMIEGEQERADSLALLASSLLSATHYIVSERRVGVPDTLAGTR